jgi:hypothetical protein
MSIKPKGGRGHTAPYQTTHLRVPIAIKDQLQLVIDDYRKLVILNEIDPIEGAVLNNVFWDKKMPSKEEAIEIAKEILKQKKSARQSLNKLLTALYGGEFTV